MRVKQDVELSILTDYGFYPKSVVNERYCPSLRDGTYQDAWCYYNGGKPKYKKSTPLLVVGMVDRIIRVCCPTTLMNFEVPNVLIELIEKGILEG